MPFLTEILKTNTSCSHADLDHLFKVIKVEYDACGMCQHVGTSTKTSSLILPGSCPSNRASITVEDAIKEVFTNFITAANCERCQKKGYRTDWFASSPENLFVQFHGGDTQQTNTQVQLKNRLVIPEGCVFEELQDKRKLEYELYGVVFHKGTSFQGHYTIAVRGPNEGWTEIDDLKSNPLEETKFLASQQNRRDAYLLAYRRVRGRDKTEQSKPSYPPNNQPSATPLKVLATKPASEGKLPHARPANNDNQVKLEQTIRPEGAAMPWAHILNLDHFAGTQFEPKDQDIELGMKFTLPTGEVVEGSGSISLTLSGSRKRAREPAEIADAKMAKKRKTEPKAAAKKASKRTRRAESDAPYEPDNPRSERKR